MKKIIAILLLLLLIGGGGAAYWYFQLREEGPVAEAEQQFSRIELDTISIARIKNGIAEQLFSVQVVLLVDDPEKDAKVRAVLPSIVDALIVELHWLLSRKIMEQYDFDQELIRTRLEKAAIRRIGAGWVHRLTVRNIERIELR
jgi:hypothetical protein